MDSKAGGKMKSIALRYHTVAELNKRCCKQLSTTKDGTRSDIVHIIQNVLFWDVQEVKYGQVS